MVNEFCGFLEGVIGKKLPSDNTLNNLKKSELIKLLHTAQHNYETLMWFYNNAVNVNMRNLKDVPDISNINIPFDDFCECCKAADSFEELKILLIRFQALQEKKS